MLISTASSVSLTSASAALMTVSSMPKAGIVKPTIRFGIAAPTGTDKAAQFVVFKRRHRVGLFVAALRHVK